MEMECKVVITHSEGFEKLIALLGNAYGLLPIAVDAQENHFLDTPNRDLAHAASVLRLRLIQNTTGPATCEITLKEDAHTTHGTTLRWATAAEVPLAFARSVLENPNTLLEESCHSTPVCSDPPTTTTSEQNIANALRIKYNITQLVYMGGFRTVRTVYPYPMKEVQSSGLTLKIDRVEYPFGVQHEVEVAGVTVPIGDVLEELCSFLEAHKIAHQRSEVSKYETFVRGKASAMVNGDIRSSSICM